MTRLVGGNATRRLTLGFLSLGMMTGGAACTAPAGRSAGSTAPAQTPGSSADRDVTVIQDYGAGLSGVHAANPDVKLSVRRDPAVGDEPVLSVEYPAPTADPAGRDVWCEAENQDWSAGHAISFRIKPDHAVKLSLSFFDRNRALYTTWSELQGSVWQQVRVSFDQLRPNPYFQPPDAKTGNPIDVSQVKGVAFAPHDETTGHLSIGKFVVSQ